MKAFPLGQTVITVNAQVQIPEPEILSALQRHHCGDWGDVAEDDWQENQRSMAEGFRLLSVYHAKRSEILDHH